MFRNLIGNEVLIADYNVQFEDDEREDGRVENKKRRCPRHLLLVGLICNLYVRLLCNLLEIGQ